MSMRIKDGKLTLGALTGGKLDDITVVVARVTAEPRRSSDSNDDAGPATCQEEGPSSADSQIEVPESSS